jgi:hypothetical protein
MDNSLRELVRNILSDCKIDVDVVEKEDPEFIEYLGNQILDWHNNNK